MSQLFGQLIYTSFAGVGFTVLKSAEVPPEVQQFFLQQIVYQYWDAYAPPSIGYKAIYLHQISSDQTLFGWLYNDGFDDFGRAHVPYFICYYFAGKLQTSLLNNIFNCLQIGTASQIDREVLPDFIETIFITDFNKYTSVRDGIAVSSEVCEQSNIALAQGNLLNLFISNNAEIKFVKTTQMPKASAKNEAKVSNFKRNIVKTQIQSVPTQIQKVHTQIQNVKTQIQGENKKYQVEDYRQIILAKAALSETTGKGMEAIFNFDNSFIWGCTVGIASLFVLMFGSFYIFRLMTLPVIDPETTMHVSITPNIQKIGNINLTKTLTGHTDAVWSVVVSKDGKTVVSGDEDWKIKVWNLETNIEDNLIGHTATIRSLVLTDNDKTLISGSDDGKIKIWNLQKNQLVNTLFECNNPIWSVAITPDGSTIISGNEIGELRFWNFHTGKLLRTNQGHRGRIFTVAINPDAQVLATGGIDKKIKIWNLKTGALIRTISSHTNAVRSLTFSPDGQYLASGSWDKTIKVWNWQTGELFQNLEGHAGRVVSVNFSRDGKYLVSGGLDNKVKVWDLQSGKLLHTLSNHSDWVLGVATNSDKIVSASKDKTVKVWNFSD
ncbi:WD40 repeat domain-containing protein [Dendronalium sp. ChiSLP03b]|uniref:WD40 repeat domain-containing protein n=1 Tax=Dendronalium sp. ChiSLP03b TaxID=3075381 RepID=UPI002AD35A2C|nr:WD40 repeat domain-containing protein [Dendronalium sp. ChiSLP03b]MDZ8203384.1 WD40 repeat domain-containing protein [Dendronalium sp. ChiSLP03b]